MQQERETRGGGHAESASQIIPSGLASENYVQPRETDKEGWLALAYLLTYSHAAGSRIARSPTSRIMDTMGASVYRAAMSMS